MSISLKEGTDYEVCFVQTDCSSEQAVHNLKLAFEAMETNQLEPIWISCEECMKFTEKERKIFIVDPFDGKVYDHLKSLQCRIVGPLCILYCLQYGDCLPKRPYPVYSVSMRKITISCSNIENEHREDICQKVQLMGGFFSKDFTKSVTHLVVGGVGSKKYQVAANIGLPIMVPDWISDVWESGQHQQLHATDSCFDKYKCPIFKGLVITVSQIGAQERLSLKTIIEENGGSYSGALKSRVTTHLVLSEPTGDKYRFAKNWKVFCVRVNWIHDSVEAGYCRDESLYALEETFQQPKRSTPKKDTSCNFPLVDCSEIVQNISISHLDETTNEDISVPSVYKDYECSALDAFDVSTLPKYGQYLDGCKIFLTGFNEVHGDKLKRIVNAGGGVRFGKYTESVSHVICGQLLDDVLNNLKSSSTKPYVVNCNWLLECCKKEQLVDEKPFLCTDISFNPEDNEADIEKDKVTETTSNFQVQNNAGFEQVNEPLVEGNCQNHSNSKIQISQKAEYNIEKSDNQKKNVEINMDDRGTTEDEELVNTEELFKGLKFIIVGFGEKDTEILASMIESHSGVVCDINKNTCDIAIVPVIFQDFDISAQHVVTNCWLQKCIEDCRVFDFDENELFKPFSISPDAKPFSSFVVSVSQYTGAERDCLMHLADVLGATCQEYFVRKANKSKGVLANTHLVAATAEGSKYEASKKWKIPAVTKQWVLDAAKSGILPPTDRYLVDACHSISTNSEVNNIGDIPLENHIEKNKSDPMHEVNVLVPQLDPVAHLIDKHKIEGQYALSPSLRQAEISLNSTYNSDVPSNYKFQVSGLLKDLDSSCTNENSSFSKRLSLPIEEMFGKNLASALRHVNNELGTPSRNSEINNETSLVKNAETKENVNSVLSGVVLCVARKLSHLQTELNEIAASLGAQYLWCYDNTCTHFIFSGKPKDITKEFREARSQGIKIVAPEWLYACRDQNMLVEEDLYPHTFKSNLTLTNEISVVKMPTISKVLASSERSHDLINKNKDVSPVQTVDFNKQLNELLVAAKSAKKRQNRRMANSVSSSPVTEIIPMPKYPRHLSDAFLNQADAPASVEEQDTGSQSQGYPITWDDPTGRLEREKIAARLANTAQEVNIPVCENIEVNIIGGNVVNLPVQNSPSEMNDFVENPMTRKSLRTKKRKFMFTNIPDADKNNFIKIIKKLGGEVSDEKAFDISATHLVVANPTKNEKFLSSVASGKWIMHPSFLLESEKLDTFLDEEKFEWGGPSTNEFIENLGPSSVKIAFCPLRWRKKLGENCGVSGAFQDWKVSIFAESKAKLLTYTKILESGSAEIFSSQFAESSLDKLSHIIVDMKEKSTLKLDINSFASHNVKCVKPEYLAFYLIEDPPPNVENFLVTESKAFNISEGSSKRRNLSTASRQSKRNKLK